MPDIFGNHQLALPYRSLGEILAGFAARDPNKIAIVDIDQESSITYGELEKIVTDIGADLKARGISKGDHVVLLSDEVLEKLLLWFGLWRIGAVVAPVNVELNITHLNSIVSAIAPKLVLIHDGLDTAAMTKGVSAPVLGFGRMTGDNEYFSALKRGTNPRALPDRNEPEDWAAMVCTSGTTDRPKIVVYDHCSYWLMGLSTQECFQLDQNDRTLEYRSFGWNSAQVVSLLPFLQIGPTMHIAKRFSASRFLEWIRNYGITFSAGVPTVINILLNRPADAPPPNIPTLRLMSSSSAPLAPEQWERFEKTYGVTLLQLYGMSEAGWICGNRMYKKRVGTVGLPALHQEFEIVDGDGNPCPPNVEGEATCGGPQCSIGLLRDDGSIDPVRGRRIKTGDLATMDEDGFVRITGRSKDLIIRGGVNISPVEVDAVLLAHPGIADAASLGVPDAIYGEEVIAFAVLKAGTHDSEDAIRSHCASRLPLPKQPKRIFIVDHLPKSDRGKVLRDRLRERWVLRQQPPL